MAFETGLERPSGREFDLNAFADSGGSAGMDPLCRFAGGIAHDFNNLLTVINGYCQLLITERMDSERSREYSREIFRAGEKAAEVVEMIMAYAGRLTMWIETFDVNEQLEKMRDFLSLYLGESITLNMRLCGESGPVCGNCGLFQWALTNIFMNAKEAMPDGGYVHLTTRLLRDGRPVSANSGDGAQSFEISIRDSGHGMEKDVLDRIFDPYFSTKPCSNVPGQGLGLACTKGIVSQFRGGIDAESAPGAGTLIRIRLPIASRF